MQTVSDRMDLHDINMNRDSIIYTEWWGSRCRMDVKGKDTQTMSLAISLEAALPPSDMHPETGDYARHLVSTQSYIAQ